MKRITLFIFILLANTLAYSQVKWMTMDEALKAQKLNPKKIYIDFYADWCGPCKLMDKNTFTHPIIINYLNEDYYRVKFNTEGNETFVYQGRTFSNPKYQAARKRNSVHEFAQFMNITSIPTSVFLDEVGNPITMFHGALSPREMEPYLPFFAHDEYKKVKTKEDWEAYQKKFKSKIKE